MTARLLLLCFSLSLILVYWPFDEPKIFYISLLGVCWSYGLAVDLCSRCAGLVEEPIRAVMPMLVSKYKPLGIRFMSYVSNIRCLMSFVFLIYKQALNFRLFNNQRYFFLILVIT